MEAVFSSNSMHLQFREGESCEACTVEGASLLWRWRPGKSARWRCGICATPLGRLFSECPPRRALLHCTLLHLHAAFIMDLRCLVAPRMVCAAQLFTLSLLPRLRLVAMCLQWSGVKFLLRIMMRDRWVLECPLCAAEVTRRRRGVSGSRAPLGTVDLKEARKLEGCVRNGTFLTILLLLILLNRFPLDLLERVFLRRKQDVHIRCLDSVFGPEFQIVFFCEFWSFLVEHVLCLHKNLVIW